MQIKSSLRRLDFFSVDSMTSPTQSCAALIGIADIQGYVFSSNKLLEISGGSELIRKVLSSEYLEKFSSKEKLCLSGGGHTLFLFDTKKEAIGFIENWSRNLMRDAPGLQPVAVIMQEFDPVSADSLTKLFNLFSERKRAWSQSNSILPPVGAARCNRSGLSQQGYSKHVNEYVSDQVHMRLLEAKKLRKRLLNVLQFNLIDDLNQIATVTSPDKTSLGLIHLDGNGFGGLFERKALSDAKKIADAINQVMNQKLYTKLLSWVQSCDWPESWNKVKAQIGIPILPLLANDGDEVSLVCPGPWALPLGLELNRFLTDAFKECLEDSSLTDNAVTLSMGIAVVKGKYPIGRALHEAKSLCKAAKAEMDEDYPESYLAFRDLLAHDKDKLCRPLNGLEEMIKRLQDIHRLSEGRRHQWQLCLQEGQAERDTFWRQYGHEFGTLSQNYIVGNQGKDLFTLAEWYKMT